MPGVCAACARAADVHTGSDEIHGHSPCEIVQYRGLALVPVEGSECFHSPRSYDERNDEPCEKSYRPLFFAHVFQREMQYEVLPHE